MCYRASMNPNQVTYCEFARRVNDLFLMPLGPDQHGMRLEAVFNQLNLSSA